PVDYSGAREAAFTLGVAFAKERVHIAVFTADPAFIESEVVRGYCTVADAPKKGIKIFYPAAHAATAVFAEQNQEEKADLFDPRADSNVDWEASYYRSLPNADGVVLIGGAASVLTTGYLALAYRLPIIAVAGVGGAGYRIWQATRPGI